VDRLAREGVRFESCIAVASHTFPPIVSLLMGQDTATHGLVNASRYGGWAQSPSWRDRDTPLKILERRGMMIDGELVLRWRPLGFRRDTEGRDIERYFETHRGQSWFFLAEPYPTHLPYNPPDEYYRLFLEPGYEAGAASEERMKLVRSRLLVHPPGLLSKLEAGEEETLPDDLSDTAHRRTVGIVEFEPEEDRPALLALYDGEVRVFDDLVGRWIAKLEELELLDDTLVIVVADHGEELLERGHVGHSSCNLRGTLYDESIKVPLIMRYPPRLPRGTVVEQQVSQIDVMPTVFDLLGIPRPEFMDGSSLLPLVQGNSLGWRREAYAETSPAGWQALRDDRRGIWCVRTEGWKLISNTVSGSDLHRYELYDLRADPGERVNLYRPHRPVAVELEPKLLAYIRRAGRIQI
jgi:arylsulfatase A-like enzyme